MLLSYIRIRNEPGPRLVSLRLFPHTSLVEGSASSCSYVLILKGTIRYLPYWNSEWSKYR